MKHKDFKNRGPCDLVVSGAQHGSLCNCEVIAVAPIHHDVYMHFFADSVTSKISEADNNSITSLDNSFEMFPATIPPYQPRRESLDDSDDLKSKENFTPFSKAKISLEHGSAKVNKY